MKIRDILVIGAIGGASLLSSCQSDKEQCIESGKIEQINALVTKPDSLQSTIKGMSEDDVVALLKCSNLFDPGDQNRVHAVVLQEIGKNFSPEQVNKRPKEVRKYLAYMNIFSLGQLGLTNEDMPQKSAYEKARFGNIDAKSLTFDNKEFFKIKNHMLVIAASNGEKYQFEANLWHNWKELKGNKSTRNGITKFGKGQTIHIVSPENIDKLAQTKYGIIQIKGHTGDMSLIEQIKPFIQDDATIVILGGCNSELYTEKVLQLGGIPITNKGLGEGTHNDHVSIQLLKQAREHPTIPGVIASVREASKVSSQKFNFPDSELTEKINGAIDN